jgi:hypothetical protein
MSSEERASHRSQDAAISREHGASPCPGDGSGWEVRRDAGCSGTPGGAMGEDPASVRFLWIDDESGDELVVEVSGGEEFFRELEKIGFLREIGPGPSGPQGAGREPSWKGSHDTAPRRSEGPRLNARMDVGSRERGAGVELEGADRTWQERRRA